MKKLLSLALLFISLATSAQRMLVLPDTPQYAGLNRGVWVFRLADGLPYYSNGTRWVASTGGLGPQTISDSLTAYNSRVVTSYNGVRGAVKGVDTIWFTNLGTVINWRFNGVNYNQLITGTGSVPDSTLFATVYYVNNNFATLTQLGTKLNISDTTNKWLTDVYRKPGTDSVFKVKGGTHTFAFKDSIGSGGGGGISDGDKGDITVSSSGTVWTIDNNAVTNAKINDVAWGKVTGAPAFITNIPSDSSLSISNRINLKLNISDTAAMLSPYLRKIDTTGKWIGIGWLPTLAGKQDALVSGTNIKTINSNSVLGSGNLTTDQLLPSQTGNSGKYLKSNGTNASWETVTAGTLNEDSTAAHIRKGTYSQRPLNPKHGAVFLQTDGWEGNHIYDSVMGKWQFHGVPSQIDISENFHAAAPNTVPRMSNTTSGTGSGIAIIREKKYGSFLRLSTGTTSSGYASFDFQEAAAMTMAPLDSMIIQRQWWVTLDTLSDATNSYQVAIGYLAHQNLWTFSSCIFFYTHSTNSGNWTTRTRKFDNSANMTNKDTGVPAVFGVRTKLAYKINGYTQAIYFYINDVLVTTHSTAGGDNIPMPNASSVSAQYNGGIYKTAGTENRNLIVDEVLYYTIKREY